MDGVALLHRAQNAGLQIEAAGKTLKITGPKRAEPVVRLLVEHKAEILAALALNKNELSYWDQRYTARTFEWFNGHRDWPAARRIAWGDLQNEWHKTHGRRWPAWQCAGCEKPIGGAIAIDLPDDNRVHLEPIDCLIEFGRHWRGDANAGLIALGLTPPDADNGASSANVSDQSKEFNGHNAVADVAEFAKNRRQCAQCRADDDGNLLQFGRVYLHKECRRFWHPAAMSKNTPTGETA